jgi:hypothetical protein
MLSVLKKNFQKPIEDFYKITEGNVIFSGSLSLKLNGIINRELNDFDLNISLEDWIKYKPKLDSVFKFYPGIRLNYSWFIVDSYTCYTDTNIEFHVFVDLLEQEFEEIYIEGIKCKVLKPELVLKHKEIILKEESYLTKHISDIELVKHYLNEK